MRGCEDLDGERYLYRIHHRGGKPGSRLFQSSCWLAEELMAHYQLSTTSLGGGAAGFAGAVRGWDLGKKVMLIEKKPKEFGGASLETAARFLS